jgi:hypothetical protein
MTSVRVRLVVLVSLLAVLVPLAYVVAVSRETAGPPAARAVRSAQQGALPDRPRMLFRSTQPETYGLLSAVPAAAPSSAPVASGRSCDRVDARAGRIVCISVDGGFLDTVHAYVLDDQLQVVHELDITGVPSRVRLSPDGRRVAVTVFVTGHSYAAAGFSTSTSVWDTTTGERVGELEDFRFLRDGAEVDAVDRNFWGVTFDDDGRTFYATMATGGRTSLVRGDVDQRRGEVVADDVECPSLSPDGTRVAFKQRRSGDAVSWTLAVLDLRTRTRTVLPVDEHVDDQPYWLDDETVAYGAARGSAGADASRQDAWAVPADGTGPPRLLREDAWSLVVDG